ncbi:MAG: HEPN domain-containing protein [Candidatus Latescibacteria bacterium]|nr:HEPN domain-containing protein [Candidatus Latescibacterota bacterium]
MAKELIKGFLQKSEKKLKVAKKLLRSEDYEDAVSRAYYAVYHAAQALLFTEGQKAETHKGVVTLFGLLFVKTGKFSRNTGKYLANLKDDREAGDYEIFSYIDRETTERALKEAEEFVKETKVYLKNLELID